ncbi:hypothetical protein CPLU01_11920 [Colletotrichum plurivorum]|uniref:Uncharacterized protein n=1 Tax=Colletotrichum plurivorum TaxID=2175906 RepID=A0A8H6K0Q9_9PEZI|nr:hypothetical protein CPLU01_11920 [Colletotrichum plurivorum]
MWRGISVLPSLHSFNGFRPIPREVGAVVASPFETLCFFRLTGRCVLKKGSAALLCNVVIPVVLDKLPSGWLDGHSHLTRSI